MRTLFYIAAFLIISSIGAAQPCEWTVTNGKAHIQSVIAVPDRDASYLYKQVSRWLMATFKNPEDALKARIEPEYLRGEGYHSGIFKPGALTSVDFGYSFSIEIKNELVRLTLSNGVVMYDDRHETIGGRPLEGYLGNIARKKKDRHARGLVAAVNAMTENLLKSLESFLLTEDENQNAW